MLDVQVSQLIAARAMLGMALMDVQKAGGASTTTLNNIERSLGDPRTSTLRKLVEFYQSKVHIRWNHE